VFEPLTNAVVVAAVVLEALAATVFHYERRFRQQNAALRVAEYDAAPFVALNNLCVIERGVEAEQRELEPAATVLRAVATSRVAPGFREDRLHFAREAHRYVRGRLLDNNGHARLRAVRFDGDCCASVRDRAHDTLFDAGDFRVGAREGRG